MDKWRNSIERMCPGDACDKGLSMLGVSLITMFSDDIINIVGASSLQLPEYITVSSGLVTYILYISDSPENHRNISGEIINKGEKMRKLFAILLGLVGQYGFLALIIDVSTSKESLKIWKNMLTNIRI